MTVENQNIGSEHGIEVKGLAKNGLWIPVNPVGEGFETYEEAYQSALTLEHDMGMFSYFRIVVYNYSGSKRKNIRILTNITGDEK